MGDRGNIVVKQGRGHAPVWLYTHWSGCDVPLILQNALKRKERWDNEHHYLVVDPDEGTVAVIAQRDGAADQPLAGKVLARWTMTEYIELPITEETTPEDLPKLKRKK